MRDAAMALDGQAETVARRAPWYIWLILALHLALGLLYSIVTPAWEAVDEAGHLLYVEYIATRHTLPPAGEVLVPRVGASQGTQPPLYYALAALPAALVDIPEQSAFRLNRYAGAGTAEFGVNMVVHDLRQEAFPWRGELLALHLARAVSVALSTVGVWFVFLLANWLLPVRRPIAALATAIAAFSPQYLFIGSSVTNDVLIAALGCATLYYACRLALGDMRWANLAGLGISLGLALLTKNTAVGLVVIGAAALFVGSIGARQAGAARRALLGSGIVVVAVLILAGWWIGRNLLIYGSPVSRDQDTVSLLLAGLRQPGAFLASRPWAAVPDTLWYAFQTFWGTFGWENVGLPMWVYLLIACITSLAVLSCLFILVHRSTPRRLRGAILFLGFSTVLVIALTLSRGLVRGGPHLAGRFLFLTLPAVSLLCAVGLLWWLPRPAGVGMAALHAAALLAFAAAVPFFVIRPAYAPPALLASQALPAGAEPIQARFSDRAELYGYRIWPAVVPQGQAIGVTLYFKALRTNTENFAVGVYASDSRGHPYGQVIRFPGRGNYATSLWQPGDLIEDTFWVPIGKDLPAPRMGHIAVSMFFDQPTPVRLLVSDGEGKFVGEAATFGRFKIAAARPASIPLEPAIANFGDQIALLDVQWPQGTLKLGDTISVTARIQALQDLETDYVLFVHFLNLAGYRHAGADAQPRAGDYPTGLWAKGEGATETRQLRIPPYIRPGLYQLGLGIYRADTGERLPIEGTQTVTGTQTLWLSPGVVVK